MPQLANYPSGFAYGLTIRGVPLIQAQPGQALWVGNSTNIPNGCVGGNDGNPGTFQRPFATLQAALDNCNASEGDIVFVRPGHAETISTAAILLLNKAGVAIIGLGSGALRPTFTFTTATTANIPVTAANMAIQNLLFVANFADIASYMTATGTNAPVNFLIDNCEFRDTASNLNALNVFTSNATDNSCDGLTMTNSKVFGLGSTAGSAAFELSGSIDRLTIQSNFFASALAANSGLILLTTTSKVLTRVLIDSNRCQFVGLDAATGNLMITTATTNTGIISNNFVNGLRAIATATLVTASSGFHYYDNKYHLTADVSGVILPAAQT